MLCSKLDGAVVEPDVGEVTCGLRVFSGHAFGRMRDGAALRV